MVLKENGEKIGTCGFTVGTGKPAVETVAMICNVLLEKGYMSETHRHYSICKRRNEG